MRCLSAFKLPVVMFDRVLSDILKKKLLRVVRLSCLFALRLMEILIAPHKLFYRSLLCIKMTARSFIFKRFGI